MSNHQIRYCLIGIHTR